MMPKFAYLVFQYILKISILNAQINVLLLLFQTLNLYYVMQEYISIIIIVHLILIHVPVRIYKNIHACSKSSYLNKNFCSVCSIKFQECVYSSTKFTNCYDGKYESVQVIFQPILVILVQIDILYLKLLLLIFFTAHCYK
ncbi:unnamed protein product [Paramecium sonneborni]|uniref:Transmembrane protein n=1 Tax=Paramecium sonneborni TaxID=65129 RepID=A0A8S1RSE6_9CILI|nr:unnamed protein product [Paramecium sonneborni]